MYSPIVVPLFIAIMNVQALVIYIFTRKWLVCNSKIQLFRELRNCEMLEVVSRLRVLSRSSSKDRQILLDICVTGNGANDGPALKIAHVGFSMGINCLYGCSK